ncbi:Hypothetical protein BCD_1888 (plasmid) [Borrelia crocidurae DOU]|uniref:Mlp lipoprotein family protein n=1 Tax=Borrelia crocidurae DOU TaxID=1293575 RepID=W5SLC9_9SPIR|nr:hypothetical protein [Borrelia crocidurae]AHH07954.1 Hypothetical protein BCD_1888 [Borrelia crocidurae DOU]
MKKNKSSLMLYIMLFLYACGANQNSDTLKKSQYEMTLTLPINSSKSNLTVEEKNKFGLLIYAFDILKQDKLLSKQDTLSSHQNVPTTKITSLINKYDRFRTWISDDAHVQEQKKLANSFHDAYTFLINKQNELASNQEIRQYIEGAFVYYSNDKYKGKHKYNPRLYGSIDPSKPNYVDLFFDNLITTVIGKYDTNEEIFQKLKEELQNKESDTYKRSLALWTD